MKFSQCSHCGNMIGYVEDVGVPLVCCGEPMKELVPGAVDAAQEKHVPEFKVEGNKVIVEVGSVEHPMTPEHFIGWIAIETKEGNQRKLCKAKPYAEFALCEGDSLVAVYAYCNLHGLWVNKA